MKIVAHCFRMSDKSNNQLHGKIFEGLMKASSRFSGAADIGRDPTQPFDIEAEYDKNRQITTSVKSAKGITKSTNGVIVGLSDARRFWRAVEKTHRLLVGQYKQNLGIKEFHIIYEFIIEEADKKILFGKISKDDIIRFHNTICGYGQGQHKAAREKAKEIKRELKDKGGIIQLNPKIDSKTQRRLQCSVKLDDLIKALSTKMIVHKKTFGALVLPIQIKSGERQFSK